MSKQNRVTYGIYLPNDSEQWFGITFTNKARAYWFAESNGLNPNEYEVRDTRSVVEETQKEVA